MGNTIEAIRAAYQNIQGIDPCQPTYGKLCDLLDSLDNDTLKGLAGAQIKFVSKLAINRCVRRGLI